VYLNAKRKFGSSQKAKSSDIDLFFSSKNGISWRNKRKSWIIEKGLRKN